MKKQFLGLTFIFIAIASLASGVEVFQSAEIDVINQEIAQGNLEKRHSMTSQEKSALLAKEKSAKKELFPFESTFTPGDVTPHHLANKAPVMNNFFVMGDDDTSIAWLKQHKDFLKENKALGFITNIASSNRLVEIENQTGWQPLLPVSMQGGEAILGTNHLPLMVINKEVSQ